MIGCICLKGVINGNLNCVLGNRQNVESGKDFVMTSFRCQRCNDDSSVRKNSHQETHKCMANMHEHGRVLDGDNGTLGISHHESVCGTENKVCRVRSALKTFCE